MRRSVAARLLELRVRIPPGARMSVRCVVVCCTVESSATGQSLVRSSPSECGECDWWLSRTQTLMRPWPARVVKQRRTVFIFELLLWCLNFCFVIGGFQILISEWSPDVTCYCCSCVHGCRSVLVSATVVWWRPLRYRSFEVVHHNYLALQSIYSLLFWDALWKTELGLTDLGDVSTILRNVEICPPKNGVFCRTSRSTFLGHNVKVKWPSPYRTVRLGYKNQSVNVV
jgi:hypothetical protein